MDSNIQKEKTVLFDGSIDDLIKNNLLSKEEAEKEKKFKEIEQKHIEAVLNAQYDLAEQYLNELKNMI